MKFHDMDDESLKREKLKMGILIKPQVCEFIKNVVKFLCDQEKKTQHIVALVNGDNDITQLVSFMRLMSHLTGEPCLILDQEDDRGLLCKIGCCDENDDKDDKDDDDEQNEVKTLDALKKEMGDLKIFISDLEVYYSVFVAN